MDHTQFSRLGGLARKAKLSKEQLSDIGKKGGRPRKVPPSTPVINKAAKKVAKKYEEQ